VNYCPLIAKYIQMYTIRNLCILYTSTAIYNVSYIQYGSMYKFFYKTTSQLLVDYYHKDYIKCLAFLLIFDRNYTSDMGNLCTSEIPRV